MKSKVSQLINQIDPEKDQCHKCKRYYLKKYLKRHIELLGLNLSEIVCSKCLKKALEIMGISQEKKYNNCFLNSTTAMKIRIILNDFDE